MLVDSTTRARASNGVGGRELPGPYEVQGGGDEISPHRQDRHDGLQHPGRSLRMAQRTLRGADRHVGHTAEAALDATPLRRVVRLGTGAVGVDVSDVLRLDIRIRQGRAERSRHPPTFGVR